MRVQIIRVLACAMTFGVAVPAGAQVCAGAGSFASGPFQASASVGVSDTTRGVGGGFGGGNDSIFAVAQVAAITIDGTDGTGFQVGGTVGSDHAVDSAKSIHFCPVGNVAYTTGPHIGTFDTSTLAYSIGGRVGITAAQTQTIGVIPTLGISAEHQRVTINVPGVGDQIGADTFGVAQLGVGFLFDRRIALIPAVSVPFGLEGGKTVFDITLAVNFRR